MKRRLNLRQRTLTTIIMAFLLLVTMVFTGLFIGENQLAINIEDRNSPPSFANLFGTDWLGRDMLTRTIKGLTLSLAVGMLAAVSSTIIALILSILASWNRTIDYIVTWLIDLFLSVPHIVLLLLITFAFGGGFEGIVIGLALTHWPSLARVLRSEILQVKTAEYVGVSRKLGKSQLWIARHHFLPHLIPQLLIGFILLFPHAILHEAAITFLGFGLSTEQPAIGIILSESMRYLSTGMWWLAFFPGLALLLMVGIFDLLGQHIRRLIDPFHGQKGS
ncbi:peptide/nickel transport system permease protein [Virgibacillus natechei]|uniref:Peptide/nickel transport system permease protein n=1 Tax=Virgibacillus natechei TaxID=1216297 RepID=A0ABS4ICE1_9BACI|nr:ABC transporter permease [Virgibacillus natechei]MBP1968605.1 peptide/nickel transport system permease protein [Virgibacillus natechei]UZD14847.1 ABC transporter permease [Virgibacillus natechei]